MKDSQLPRVVPPPPASFRIMLLDDDIFLLEMLGDMLRSLGQDDIVTESDSRRALLTLRDVQPQLLICDLSMPELDGIEFLHLAAGIGYRGGLVLLSGMDEAIRRAAERLAMAHGLRVLGAYQKPMNDANLQEVLARAGVGLPAGVGPAGAAGAAP
jgi:CheY-like chemotaxis protein